MHQVRMQSSNRHSPTVRFIVPCHGEKERNIGGGGGGGGEGERERKRG